jgi:hypothetical protein
VARWIAPALLILLLLCFAPAASANRLKLSKADARLAAESKAYDFSSQPGNEWASSVNIQQCHRYTRYRVTCAAEVHGSELETCNNPEPQGCRWRYHQCAFLIAVHQAGYSAIAVIKYPSMSCTSYEYIG